MGAIDDKIYDFIFGKENFDEEPDNIKEKNEEKNSRENSNKSRIDNANNKEMK